MGMSVIEARISDIPATPYSVAAFAEEPLRKLQHDLADIAISISKRLNDICLGLITVPTVDDFIALREVTFPSYFQLTMALNKIVISSLDPALFHRLAQESLARTQEHFTPAAELYLDKASYQEAIFSITTLQSAQKWIPRLALTKPSDLSKDHELSEQYGTSAIWSFMHLQCIDLSIRLQRPLGQDLLGPLLGGLRQSVMAYAYVRSALELRNVPDARYGETLLTDWDDEDEALANSA